jgi:hypothetical protein
MLMVAVANSNLIVSWTPQAHESLAILILVTMGFAFTNSLAISQVRSLFGIYHLDNKSSYTAAMLFETFGVVLGYALSTFYCTRVKLYVYSFVAIVSVLTYLFLDAKTNQRLKNESKSFLSSLNFDMNMSAQNRNSFDTLDSFYAPNKTFKTDLKRMDFITF